jgi:seryl-tRNA synthetase
MIDLRLIREKTDEVREGLRRLNANAPVDEILAADERRRALLSEVEKLKAELNRRSKAIGRAKPEEREALIAETKGLGEKIEQLDEEVKQVEKELNELLLLVPNMPHPSAPVGKDESENVVVRSWGERREFDFEPLAHWEIGERLGIIDFERGVKISGSRFYVLRGMGARLQRALITFFLDLHTKEHGYTEIYPPFVVKEKCLIGAGQLPKFRDNIYHDVEDDLWMIGTAEIPITNLHRDEILDGSLLPLRYVGYSACFRREKMSAGRDVRGLKRGHQFDKVELYKFTTPETSDEELEKLVADAEDVMRRLQLPYRVVQMCTGDLGFTAMKKYDIEVWAPGCGEWLEVSSCSNCGDFQARRANIRYRTEKGARPRFVHTLNGSGVALPRTMIAVLENYQQPDGSVGIPEALLPYMGGCSTIEPAAT